MPKSRHTVGNIGKLKMLEYTGVASGELAVAIPPRSQSRGVLTAPRDEAN